MNEIAMESEIARTAREILLWHGHSSTCDGCGRWLPDEGLWCAWHEETGAEVVVKSCRACPRTGWEVWAPDDEGLEVAKRFVEALVGHLEAL